MEYVCIELGQVYPELWNSQDERTDLGKSKPRSSATEDNVDVASIGPHQLPTITK